MIDETSEDLDTQADFPSHYEGYLDAVYTREELVETIAAQLRSRSVRRLLDCSAGTGFPALDLAADPTLSVKVHCSDASSVMLDVLALRAKELDVDMTQLTPGVADSSEERDGLQINWDSLHTVPAVYDYVMCRGNSLMYANTWDGHTEVTDKAAIGHYLEKMVGRLRPGGFLHVDAPWNLSLPPVRYQRLSYGKYSFEEKATIEPSRRRWDLTVRQPNGEVSKFQRFSTLITVQDVAEMLRDLGFDHTEPTHLPGERKTLGVIIARKRHGPHHPPKRATDGHRLADYVRT